MAQVQVGGRLSDIGHAVQAWVETHGFSIVREFVGHGIGEKLHEDPQIPNYGQPGRGPKLAAGMVLAIEPMVAMGRPETRVLADGWTAVTRDGSLAAHFEHTVAVGSDGPAGVDRAGAARRSRSRRRGRRRRWRATVRERCWRCCRGRSTGWRMEDGREVTAHATSGAGRNFVRLVVGDRVTVEVMPRDLGRGRIVRKE